MSKPPHKLALPPLDDLFDDTFERNARRVLHAAEVLEERFDHEQLAESAPQEVAPQANHSRPQHAKATQQSTVVIARLLGSLALGIGIMTAAFAVTLFVLNSFNEGSVLDSYVWPLGLSGQVLILIGFWLRLQSSTNSQSTTNLEKPGEPTSSGESPIRPKRWDTDHAVPAVPHQGTQQRRGSKKAT